MSNGISVRFSTKFSWQTRASSFIAFGLNKVEVNLFPEDIHYGSDKNIWELFASQKKYRVAVMRQHANRFIAKIALPCRRAVAICRQNRHIGNGFVFSVMVLQEHSSNFLVPQTLRSHMKYPA